MLPAYQCLEVESAYGFWVVGSNEVEVVDDDKVVSVGPLQRHQRLHSSEVLVRESAHDGCSCIGKEGGVQEKGAEGERVEE